MTGRTGYRQICAQVAEAAGFNAAQTPDPQGVTLGEYQGRTESPAEVVERLARTGSCRPTG